MNSAAATTPNTGGAGGGGLSGVGTPLSAALDVSANSSLTDLEPIPLPDSYRTPQQHHHQQVMLRRQQQVRFLCLGGVF